MPKATFGKIGGAGGATGIRRGWGNIRFKWDIIPVISNISLKVRNPALSHSQLLRPLLPLRPIATMGLPFPLPTMAFPTYNGLRVKLNDSPQVRPKRQQAALPVPRVTQEWVADLVKAAALEAVGDNLGAIERDRSALADQFKAVLNELLGLVGDVKARDKQIAALQDEIMELRSDVLQLSDRIARLSIQ